MYGNVDAVEREVGDNSPHGPSPAHDPSRVVARQRVQTTVPAHALRPRVMGVATHCLVAVEPHHVPDRVSTSGVRLS